MTQRLPGLGNCDFCRFLRSDMTGNQVAQIDQGSCLWRRREVSDRHQTNAIEVGQFFISILSSIRDELPTKNVKHEHILPTQGPTQNFL